MGPDPVVSARALLALDAVALQWREKDLTRADNERLIRRVRETSTRLIVNGDAELARSLSIGLHLPETGLPVVEARRIVGSSALIGRSVHGVDGAREAERAGADFLTFGPIYETESKRQYGPPAGIARLVDACAAVSIPVFALGGITLERVEECLAAGAHGIAGIGMIWDTPDPTAAARALLDRLQR